MKTCTNCANYIPVLEDANSQFHIHNYCTVWRKDIPSRFIQEQKCDELCGDKEECICTNCINRLDDIEASIAVCWCYQDK